MIESYSAYVALLVIAPFPISHTINRTVQIIFSKIATIEPLIWISHRELIGLYR